MQLLKITSTPIEYEIQTEKARLEIKDMSRIEQNAKVTPAELRINTKNAQVRLDTKEMRSSLGLKSAPTLMREAAQRGMQSISQKTGEYSRMGDQLSQIQDGVTVASMVQQKMLQQPQSQTVYLPSTGPVISWIPSQLDINYMPGQATNDWEMTQNVLDYVPGKFHLNIVQYPKVEIEYLGEPNYVPKSADPNYEGE